jgi:hypothetical protein
MRALVLMQRQPKLPEVAFATHATRRFPGLLNGGQEQRNEDADNRDHHEQLNERKGGRRRSRTIAVHS